LDKEILRIYGISQNPSTNDYILVQHNFISFINNWASGNEEIDNLIQEMQLKFKDDYDVIFEWIPYNQFNEIKETSKNSSITVYSAIWKDGPYYNYYGEYTREPNTKVALKCLQNSQNTIEILVNEV
jgi:hypothetical protein